MPQHVRLTPEEVTQFRKELRSTATEELKIPIILTTDAVSRFYGFSEGDCVRITRKDGYVTFRMVKSP